MSKPVEECRQDRVCQPDALLLGGLLQLQDRLGGHLDRLHDLPAREAGRRSAVLHQPPPRGGL